MATIGQLGGLAYEIPLNQRLQQQAPMGGQMAPARVAAPVGVSDDPLASIEGLTNEYYGNAAMIQEFTNEMASKGINPFVPDYSQEGGGLAFQTMQKLLANQMYTANKLRNEQVARQQAQPLMMTGQTRRVQGVDENSFWASDPGNFYPTAIDPRIREANQSLRDDRYTQRDSDALNQANRTPLYEEYQAAIAAETDPRRREALEYQLSGLQKSTAQVYPGLLRDPNNKKYDYQLGLLRRFTNLKNGVWDPAATTQTTLGGKVYLRTDESKGDITGKYNAGVDSNGNPIIKDKVVDYWLQDPETGQVFIKYTDGNLPLEDASNLSGDAVTRMFVSNNPKYGSVDKIMEAASAVGITDETGRVVDQTLMPQDAAARQQALRGGVNSATVTQKYNVIRNELQKLTNPILGNNTIAYTLPNGSVMKVGKHRGKDTFFIDNYKELGFDKEPKNLPLDAILKYLDDFRYFDKFLVKPQQNLPTFQQFDSDI